jgi:hypothetical protein
VKKKLKPAVISNFWALFFNHLIWQSFLCLSTKVEEFQLTQFYIKKKVLISVLYSMWNSMNGWLLAMLAGCEERISRFYTFFLSSTSVEFRCAIGRKWKTLKIIIFDIFFFHLPNSLSFFSMWMKLSNKKELIKRKKNCIRLLYSLQLCWSLWWLWKWKLDTKWNLIFFLLLCYFFFFGFFGNHHSKCQWEFHLRGVS